MFRICEILAISQLFSSLVSAHSWIEQMQVIGSNGSYIGNYGYPRGYVARTDPGFNNSFAIEWLLPPTDGSQITRITDDMNLCHPYQRTANYSTKYPQLKVAPGDWVAMKYLENGHVTQPWVQAGKPYGGGTVFLYGTTQPYQDTKIVDVLKWDRKGTGGNKRGWLISSQQFDDERCHQVSASPVSMFRQVATPDRVPGQPNSTVEQWCETNLHIPEKVNGSALTVYWVWQWNTAVGTIGAVAGKDEYYTTCMDFDIASGASTNEEVIAAAKVNTLEQQDPQTTAVTNFRSRTAETMSPRWTTWNPSAIAMAEAQAATPDVYYRIPPATFVTEASTYVLQTQGTVLSVNGHITAYVDCAGAVTTGTSAPACSSTASIPLAPTTPAATIAVPTSSATQNSAANANTGATSGDQCDNDSVTVTATVTVTVSSQATSPQNPLTSSTSAYTGGVQFPTIAVPSPAVNAQFNDHQPAAVVASSDGTVHEHTAREAARHARDFRR